MARNITFTADEHLIEEAREAARAEGTVPSPGAALRHPGRTDHGRP